MKTIVYKNKKAVCEIKHEGKNVFSISGDEKDKIAGLFKKGKVQDYIWKNLLEFIDMEEEYTIKIERNN